MSKLTSAVLQNSFAPISEEDAIGLAKTIEAGTTTRACKEGLDGIRKAITSMDATFIDFDAKLQRMIQQEVLLVARAKTMTQTLKNYAGQITDGLARMDKVVGNDFEKRLELLERFVIATQALSVLEKDQRLQKIAGALR